MDTGKLVIDPIEEIQFQQNGVDLILDQVIDPVMLQEKPPWFSRLSFYLGGTKERLVFPDDLMAFVELRSTWARRGLILPPTIVDAGFKGNLTLEIFATLGVKIPYGERFAHLIFAKTSGPAEPYRGKYQGQSGVTPAKDDPC